MQVLEQLSAGVRKQLAILIDPDRLALAQSLDLTTMAEKAGVDFIFLGGSLIEKDRLTQAGKWIRETCGLPIVLFPGSMYQLTAAADAILFLSLISGRNPEWLIGHQVLAAPLLAALELEIIPTGYLLVDGGNVTAAHYISQTIPLPADKPELAVATALAGQYLGLKLIYLDAGSGAVKPVSSEMVSAVRTATQIPLIVGGGIKDAPTARSLYRAGADLLVIGTAWETSKAVETALMEFTAVKYDN